VTTMPLVLAHRKRMDGDAKLLGVAQQKLA
jgi:hypothetical protein